MQKNIDHLQEHGHKRRTIMSGERATRSVREGVSPGLLSSHYQHDVFRLTGLGIMGGWLWVRPRLNPMAHDDIKFYSKTPNWSWGYHSSQERVPRVNLGCPMEQWATSWVSLLSTSITAIRCIRYLEYISFCRTLTTHMLRIHAAAFLKLW